MIQIRNLSYRYSRQRVLFGGLEIELCAGKVYGLLGRNGAGKSSLIKNIAGLLLPTSGSCTVFGHQPQKRSPAFLQQLFFLPEDADLPYISIHDLVKVYAPFYPLFSKERFYENLNRFDVDVTAQIGKLSYGQKKKVFISFSLAVNARVLIMDEPTNGLDIPSRLTFRNLVAEAGTPENIIIISTHQVKDMDNLIDAIIVLDNSRILLYSDKTTIEQKLQFKKVSSPEETIGAIYHQPIPGGYTVIKTKDHSEATSVVDFEVLFNACLVEPAAIARSIN